MLRLICIATLLVLAKCDFEDLETFVGQWTAIKVYPDIPVQGDCNPLTLELTNDHCKCGKNERIPVFKITNAARVIAQIPVIPMDTGENDVKEALSQKCSCKNKNVDTDVLLVFRFLSENYFLAYTSMAGPHMAILIANEVPTEEELGEFEHNSTVLNGKEGATVCTVEMMTATRKISNKFAANKNITTTNWLNYQPPTTTTEPSK